MAEQRVNTSAAKAAASLESAYRAWMVAIIVTLALLVGALAYGQYKATLARQWLVAEADTVRRVASFEGQVDRSLQLIERMRTMLIDGMAGPSMSAPPELLAGLTRVGDAHPNLVDGTYFLPKDRRLADIAVIGTRSLLDRRGLHDSELNTALRLVEQLRAENPGPTDQGQSFYVSARHDLFAIYPRVGWYEDIGGRGGKNRFVDDFFAAPPWSPSRLVGPEKNPTRAARWLPVYQDPLARSAMTTVILPVYVGNRYLGAVGTDLPVGRMAIFLAKQPLPVGRIYVFDRSGIAAGGSDPASVQRMSRGPVALASMLPVGARDAVEEARERPGRFVGANGYRALALPITGSPLAAVFVASESDVALAAAPELVAYGMVLAGLLIAAVGALLGFRHKFLRPAAALLAVPAGGERTISGPWKPWEDWLEHNEAEKRRYVESLEDQNRLTNAILNSALDCVVTSDENGRIVEFNPAAERSFGFARGEVIGRSLNDTIVPNYRQDAPMLGKRVEVEGLRRDGTLFPIEVATVETSVAGKQRFVAYMRDLTERRAAQAALEDSEARLAAFLENAPVSMYLKDLDGRYVLANPFMLKALGRDAHEVIGVHYRDIVDPSTIPEIEAADRELVGTGAPRIDEGKFRAPNGTGHVISVRFPVHTADGRVSHLGGVIIDVSERKRAEARARESEGRFRTLTEFQPVPVTIARPHSGEALFANPAFYAMIGMHHGNVAEINARSLFADQDERRRVTKAILDNRQGDNLEAEMVRADGTHFPVAVSWRWIDFEDEPAVVATLIDLTVSKAAQAELERSREALHQSEKLTALGSLLAGVSHELNNPLAIVVGEASILEEDAEGTPHAATANRIKRAAERCSRIVQTFLAMARQRKPERRAIEARQLIDAALELTEYGLRASGVRVVRDLSPDVPPIWGDSDQLHQVVVNLIINAQQAMETCDGSRVLTIRTASIAGSSMVAIEVADSGPGIPADVARRMFEPFFTTKPQGVGTGIGLSYCQGIAQAHGGGLHFVERPGGATFRLELPAAELPSSEEREGDARPGGVSSAPSRPRALVVDDEPELAATLARVLEREGFRVDVAEDGAQAIERIDAFDDYSLVLSDIRMPGIDGPALYAWIRAERPHLVPRVAFATGDTLGPAAARFLADAAAPFLEKPFTRDAVRDIVRKVATATDTAEA